MNQREVLEANTVTEWRMDVTVSLTDFKQVEKGSGKPKTSSLNYTDRTTKK
jgi:hypothetical protein